MENTFAKKFWKEFELLSLEYIKDQYKDTTAQCIHTSFINDGGYDGSISLNLTKEDAPFVNEVLNLIEAKLRTDKNITIHDFAASIIAAYNFSAHTLYVVSNMNFTEGTQKITETFSNKVNLKIILINGTYLLKWIEDTRKDNGKDLFISELINSIKNIPSKSDITKYEKKHYAQIENNTDIFMDNIYLQPEKLFGSNAKNIKEDIVKIMEHTGNLDRIVILTGDVGTGKSTVMTNVGFELQQKDFIFNVLDSDNEDILSIRNVFLWVLKSLWGIDPYKIYSSENISEFIDLICISAGANIDSNIKDTIKEVFDLDIHSYWAKSDLYTTYLLKYLNIILEKRCGKNRTVLAFKNLHRAEQSVLDFIIALIGCLIKNNVGLIIELAPIEVNLNAKNNWETGRNALLHFEQSGHKFELFDFKREDAWDYLSEKLPGVADCYYEYIISHIGLKPVFLHYTIKWLELHDIVLSDKSGNYYTIAKPDEFFNGITPDQNLRILEDIIYYYQSVISDEQEIIIELFELTLLLDGAISYSLIKEMYSFNYKMIMQRLLDTGLFMQTPSGIAVNHELVLSALSRTSKLSYKICVAYKLYNNLEILQDEEFIRCKKAELLIIMKQWDEFAILAVQIGKNAFENGDYKKCIKYLSLYRKHYINFSKKNENQLLYVMYQELFAYEKMSRVKDAKELFQSFQQQIQLIRGLYKKEPDIYILTLEKLYISRYADSASQYNKAMDMLSFAKKNHDYISMELYDRICYVYALIEKKYISLESAVDFLYREKNLHPDSVELDIQYQSHEAAKYLNLNPKKSIIFYKNIVSYLGYSQKLNRDIGHAYVDILNCYILLEDWYNFKKEYKSVLDYLQANALYEEEGRLYNLDGLYWWVNSNLMEAKDAFQKSQFYFELIHNGMNGIISKINYIGLLISLHEYNAAVLEFSVASSNILEIFRVLFLQISTSRNYSKYREYIALLVLLKYGNILDQEEVVNNIIKKVSIQDLECHLEQLIKGNYPQDVFLNTCIIHNDIITLTR